MRDYVNKFLNKFVNITKFNLDKKNLPLDFKLVQPQIAWPGSLRNSLYGVNYIFSVI